MALEYVYVIKSTLLGGYKIGITRNIDRRMKQLEVGKKATKLAVFSCDDAREYERELHKKYHEFRIPQSEWFALNAADLTAVIDYLRSRTNPLFFDCPEYISRPSEPQYVSDEKARAYWAQYETPKKKEPPRQKIGGPTYSAPSSYVDYSVGYTWHAPGQRTPEECAHEMMQMYAPWSDPDWSSSSVRPAADVISELEKQRASVSAIPQPEPYYPPPKPSGWKRFTRWLNRLIFIDDGERWSLSE